MLVVPIRSTRTKTSSRSSKRAGAWYSTFDARIAKSIDAEVDAAEVAVVLGAREVEVRHVAAVVDDSLCVGLGEARPRCRRRIETAASGRSRARARSRGDPSHGAVVPGADRGNVQRTSHTSEKGDALRARVAYRRCHGTTPSDRDPRCVVPRDSAWERSAAHLLRELEREALRPRARSGGPALRLARLRVLLDDEPLPPGSSDRRARALGMGCAS